MPPKRRAKRRAKINNEPKNISGNDPFLTLPVEIMLMILKSLAPTWIKNFSRCSKYYFNVCFPMRFGDRTIIMNPKVVKWFQDGEFCEQNRRYICSIASERKWNWTDALSNPIGRNESPENLVTRLRILAENFSLFQNLRKLNISYDITPLIENNIYAAVIRSINGQSFCNTLELFEYQCIKRPDLDSSNFTSYQKLHSTLSKENREFLGKEITDRKIAELIEGISPSLPALKSARLSVTGIATPLADPGSRYLERSAFYYAPLAAAPNLTKLHIETTEMHSFYYTYGIGEKELAGKGFKFPFLEAFRSIQDLTLIKYTTPKADEVEQLAILFPGLKTLSIQIIDRKQRDIFKGDPDRRYDAISGLKHLTKAILPWPADKETGSISCDTLVEWVDDLWLKGGLGDLESVTFEGMKYRDMYDHYGARIQVTISFLGLGKGGVQALFLSGDCEEDDYQDWVRSELGSQDDGESNGSVDSDSSYHD